jgi:hypothetical protein
VSKEVEAQLLVIADSLQGGIGSHLDLVNGVGTQIGEFDRLDVAPHQLDGVEVGGITGQALDYQPGTLESDPGHHGPRLVRREPVPDERDQLALEVGVELFEELDQALGVVGAVFDLEDQSGLGPVRPEGQGRRHREPTPVEVVTQHGGLTSWSPGGPHAGEQ